MPKQAYALEKGGPKNLELSWKGMWKEFEITLDGQVVGGFEDQQALKEGQTFTLPDGSSLAVKLDRSIMGTQLNVLRNGEHVSGTAGDPETKLKSTYIIIYFVGGMNLALGLAAMLFQIEFLLQAGGGVSAAVTGAIYLMLAYFVQKRSRIALGLAMALYGIDSAIVVMNSNGAVYNIFVRILFLYVMWMGFGAIKTLKEDSEKI